MADGSGSHRPARSARNGRRVSIAVSMSVLPGSSASAIVSAIK